MQTDDEDPAGSIMTRLITDPMMLCKMSKKEEENETSMTFGQVKIDIYKLITLGVILCWGDAQLKARVLYNAIQTTMQNKIVPNERMDRVFSDCILFSTVLMMRHSCLDKNDTNFKQAEIPIKAITHELIEQIREDLMEKIYGTESKLKRKEFLEKLSSPEANWIMDAE